MDYTLGIIFLLNVVVMFTSLYLHLEDKRKREVEKLKKSIRSRELLLEIISHDLGDNLRAVITAIDLKEQVHSGYPAEIVKKFNEAAKHSAKAILATLENLSYFKEAIFIEGKTKLDFIDFDDLCENIMSTFQAMASLREINLKSEVLVGEIYVKDKNALATLLRNLIHNAIKHGLKGTSVKLNARSDGKEIIILIQNTASIANKNKLVNLFEIEGIKDYKSAGGNLGYELISKAIQHLGVKISLLPSKEPGVVIECRWFL